MSTSIPFKLTFPTIVYTTPGSHACKGGTYDYRGVRDEDELARAVKDGYYLTLDEALAKEHDMGKIDALVIEKVTAPPALDHIADPVIQQFNQVQIPTNQVLRTEDHPLDKSGGSPDDLTGLEQPSAHTQNLSDDTTLVGGTDGIPLNQVATDKTVVDETLGSEVPDLPTEGNDQSTTQGRTREELNARANELGIDYDGRISNKALAKLIADREQQEV